MDANHTPIPDAASRRRRLRPRHLAALGLLVAAAGVVALVSGPDGMTRTGPRAGPGDGSPPAGVSRHRHRHRHRHRVKHRGHSGGTVVVAVGDISCPGVCGQRDTAQLAQKAKPAAVLGLGDFQYETGTRSNLARYYDPYWGRFKSKTYAISGGRHDFYGTGDYLDYFNAGGPVRLRPEASYSFQLGSWHLVALDSYCFERDSCDESAWTRWLRADLAKHSTRCTLAYWHEPYWTSPSNHEPQQDLKPWVEVLYRAGVDVALQAHNHAYERFAPQNPDGGRDPERGIRAFTVGTGGSSHYDYHGTAANSAVKNDDTYGVLRLVLRRGGYDWRFLPVPGRSFTDSGSASCHGGPG